jgi:hypothetical protein
MKIKGKYITFLSVTLALLIGNSCSEDFLQPKPLSFYAPENALTSEDGLQAVLDNVSSSLRSEMCGDNSPFLANLKFSDVGVNGSTGNTRPWQDLNNQMLPSATAWNFGYSIIDWYWDASYKTIKDCNTIITRIDNVEFSSESKRNAILGGAYFFRAYRYYAKTLQYGDVPLVLEEVTSPRIDFFSTTKESIWKKMIKDLEFAAEHVPEADQVARGQATKAACKHLLAKYYLLEGRFDDAIKQTSDIINGGVHRLVTERFGVDMNIPGKDVIWDLHRSLNKSKNKEALLLTIDRYGMEGNTSGVMSMRNAVPYYAANIKTPNGAVGTSDSPGLEYPLVEIYGRGIAWISPSGYSRRDIWKYNGEMDWQDYRHRKDNQNWMTMEQLVYNNTALKKAGNEWYGKNLQLFSATGTLLCPDTIRSWFPWPQYKTYVEDPDQVKPQGGPGDWYVYRLAETYLLRAEAYVWKGEWQKAANDINTIRQRANAKYMYTAGDISGQQISAILDERNRELYLEEPRKVELTRIAIIYARTNIPCYNGKTYSMDRISEDNFYYDRVNEISDFYNKNVPTVVGNYFTISPHHIFWPIQEDVIKNNEEGVINQNKGYPGTENNVPPLEYQGE